MTRVSSKRAFALLTVVFVAGGVLYSLMAWRRARAPGAGADAAAVRLPAPPAELRRRPHLMFLSADARSSGHLRLAESGGADGRRFSAELVCDRMYYAAGRGVCLTRDDALLLRRYRLDIFDESFRTTRSLRLPGYPSRARVSPDGRYGAFTVFTAGHSYAAADFATRTEIVDLSTGRTFGDLETFAIRRDGAPFKAMDFNFWGVTFVPDSDRFYATLSSAGQTFLIDGDVRARTAAVVRSNAECPSVSPDGTRVVYKKRVEGGTRVRWQLTVLDLRTNRETPLTAETASVDDQAEWLDGEEIVYGIPDRSGQASAPPDLWAIRADGTGAPRLFIEDAISPVAVRPRSRAR